jgi:hypothetical protein
VKTTCLKRPNRTRLVLLVLCKVYTGRRSPVGSLKSRKSCRRIGLLRSYDQTIERKEHVSIGGMFSRAYQKSPTHIQVDQLAIHPSLSVAVLQLMAHLDPALMVPQLLAVLYTTQRNVDDGRLVQRLSTVAILKQHCDWSNRLRDIVQLPMLSTIHPEWTGNDIAIVMHDSCRIAGLPLVHHRSGAQARS